MDIFPGAITLPTHSRSPHPSLPPDLADPTLTPAPFCPSGHLPDLSSLGVLPYLQHGSFTILVTLYCHSCHPPESNVLSPHYYPTSFAPLFPALPTRKGITVYLRTWVSFISLHWTGGPDPGGLNPQRQEQHLAPNKLNKYLSNS